LNQTELQNWLQARLPADLLAGPPEIRAYSDEIVIVLQLPSGTSSSELPDDARLEIEQRLIAERREQTRPLRMRLARELQAMLGRSIAWGVRLGDSETLFTTKSAPVMTRLGRAEREVLDTLVAAGVAETRSAALAYVVRAFAVEHGEWLAEMRTALTTIDEVRSRLKLTRRQGAPVVSEEDVE
jgi:hypothetical protein